MEPNVMDRLLDRIQQQERDKLRLQRRLGRMAWHRNKAQAELDEVGKANDVERLETQAKRRTELHKKEVSRYEAELAKLREQRDRLVADNAALATARDEYRKEKHELEQDLASDAETLNEINVVLDGAGIEDGGTGTPPRVRALVRSVKGYKAYARHVREQSPVIHGMACDRVGLDHDWHEVVDLPAQGETDNG